MGIEEVIRQQSERIASTMLAKADEAASEEEIRYACNQLIDQFLGLAGLEVRGRLEYRIGAGRLDSKYQGVLLEYKFPRGPERLTVGRDGAGNRAVVQQLKTRFRDFASEENLRPDRLFGVGCDGVSFLFVRQRGGHWDVEPAQPVTPHTVERLLRALVSLGATGKSFTPESLAEDFGANSLTARSGVSGLYQAIVSTPNPKTRTLFDQWQLLFSEVCGYDIHGANANIGRLGDVYGVGRDCRPAELLFALHTYYAVFMKLLAAEIAGAFSDLNVSVLRRLTTASTSAALKREMERIESGGIWSQLGITNFLEGDLFSWYLFAWDDSVSGVVHGIALSLDSYDSSTLSVDPTESRDLLKRLYQNLFPKWVRHSLGEYLTPDWLAQHVLDEVGYDGNPDLRVLDPACGSGTFLVEAINRVLRWFEAHRHECGFAEPELAEKILENIAGFDLNPLAVMASRTNFLIAIRVPRLVSHQFCLCSETGHVSQP